MSFISPETMTILSFRRPFHALAIIRQGQASLVHRSCSE